MADNSTALWLGWGGGKTMPLPITMAGGMPLCITMTGGMLLYRVITLEKNRLNRAIVVGQQCHCV